MISELDIFNEDLENKESLEDLHVREEQLNSAVLWGTDWTTETIVSQMKKGNIDLSPSFQRREAWDDKRKSAFIESLICGFPIPQIILAESKAKKGSYIVIDGKQRLLALRRFFASPKDDGIEALKLKGLQVLGNLNSKNLEQIKEDAELSHYSDSLENQSIRTTIIRNWPDNEFLYNVFLRLNTGSLPLSTQELRQALHPGPFLDFCDRYSAEDSHLQRVLNISNPDYRMRDVELMVRYFSFKWFAKEYDGNLRLFFDNSVLSLNTNWEQQQDLIYSEAEEMDNAIEAVYSVFGNDAFRKFKNKGFDNRFNRAVFDIMVYYFSNPEIRTAALEKTGEIKDAFMGLCAKDTDFLSAFETSTKNMGPTNIRYSVWGNTLAKALGVTILIPEFNVE